mmetsp:Transcript_14013/g.28959  ORF Transcript_14013/g.28959 Transcript_14013/m.28959 type:complete len:403 (-) Transcript_14013:119-1327(-)
MLQKETGSNSPTESCPVVVNVGNLGFKLLLVGFHQGHPPGLFSRRVGNLFEFFRQIVVFCKDTTNLLPKCHHTGTRQSGQLDNFFASEFLIAIHQGVRQCQSSLRVRIQDLDRDPVRGHQNVARDDSLIVDHIFTCRHAKVALDSGWLYLGNRLGGSQDGGSSPAVKLHEFHHGRLDVVSARVKEQTLSNHTNLFLDFAGCWFVGQMDELRRSFAGTGNAQIRAHSAFLAVLLLENLARQASVAFVRNRSGQIGQRQRIQNVMGGIHNVTSQVNARGNLFSLFHGLGILVGYGGSFAVVLVVIVDPQALQMLCGDVAWFKARQRSTKAQIQIQRRMNRNREFFEKSRRPDASRKKDTCCLESRGRLVNASRGDCFSDCGSSFGIDITGFAQGNQNVFLSPKT